MSEQGVQLTGFKKFNEIDADFHAGVNAISSLGLSPSELIHHFTIYTGHVNLARYLMFYDLYKKVQHLNGNLADVGTWSGASFFYMAKLIKIFEPYAGTQVHGFDWFQGMAPAPGVDDMNQQGLYTASYEQFLQMIKIQKLEDTAIIHKMDIAKELELFFAENRHLRFKMVFIDCGIARVLEKALACFWPRLVFGGVLIMDHYNCELSPEESDLLEKYIGKNKVQGASFSRQPTAFVIKEA